MHNKTNWERLILNYPTQSPYVVAKKVQKTVTFSEIKTEAFVGILCSWRYRDREPYLKYALTFGALRVLA